MERLRLLGPVVHLDISLASFLKRVGDGGNGAWPSPPADPRRLYTNAATLCRSGGLHRQHDAGDQHHSLERLYEWLAADKTEPKG
jgi:hypothetical protein